MICYQFWEKKKIRTRRLFHDMWKLYGIQISSVHRSSLIGIQLHALVCMLSLTDFTLKKQN